MRDANQRDFRLPILYLAVCFPLPVRLPIKIRLSHCRRVGTTLLWAKRPMNRSIGVTKTKIAIGIDIGGTKTTVALVDDAGHVRARNGFATRSDRGAGVCLAELLETIRLVLSETTPETLA